MRMGMGNEEGWGMRMGNGRGWRVGDSGTVSVMGWEWSVSTTAAMGDENG